jgi:hypothetical protein
MLKFYVCDNSSQWYFGISYGLWMLSISWSMLRHEFDDDLWVLKCDMEIENCDKIYRFHDVFESDIRSMGYIWGWWICEMMRWA